ncbi:MAG: CHAT domain-containing protein [Coleofasciculaceae cyanobacterium]
MRAIIRSFWLGLLTFLLVTNVIPVAAQQFSSDSKLVNLLPKTELRKINKSKVSQNSDAIEQGISFYQAGRFIEAAQVWQQAFQTYQTQGQYLNQSLSLSYLSLAYQELGKWPEAEKVISKSLKLLTNQQPVTTESQQILAHTLNSQGSLQLAMGQTEAALDTWKRAAEAYAQAEDRVGMLGSQINQAEALQALGMYQRARSSLEQLNEQLQAQPDSSLKAQGLENLGVALQVLGVLEESQIALEQSLAITQKLDSTSAVSPILLNLGNTARDLQNYEKAWQLYQQAANTATQPIEKLEAQLNQLSLLVQSLNQNCYLDIPPCKSDKAEGEELTILLSQIQPQINSLPPSRDAIYAQVNLAENLLNYQAGSIKNKNINLKIEPITEIAQLLARAVQQAKSIGDIRAESHALGTIGKLYKQTQQWSYAQDLTQEAITLAQRISAEDIAYRWYWQLGQIFRQQGEITGVESKILPKAIAAYSQAVNSLQSLRSDLVATNSDFQFSFRDSVEPVYRQLVGLLLQAEPSQINLNKAREVIESLQLAELDNFFREACLNTPQEQIDLVDTTAAVIYPIILPDRLAVILSLPGQPLDYYQTLATDTEIESTLEQLLQSLNPAVSNKRRLGLSQQVYDWLIRPAQVKLADSDIETLVFVLDGSLRNLPMAALYDGEKYLVEKYSIALSPGLQLLEPRSLDRTKLKALTGGLTEARQGFSSLPAVAVELERIAEQISSEVLLNQEFEEVTLENKISSLPFNVVHLATHGQFSSKPEDTFLLTWNGRVQVQELDQLLELRQQDRTNPIELLVLSACQTATGDKKAALGLAGIAIKSGARSTLATLWSVQDQSTAQLMSEFYQKLTKSEISKAEALRQAQLTLLQEPNYQHPFYWAPFVLVGNWL